MLLSRDLGSYLILPLANLLIWTVSAYLFLKLGTACCPLIMAVWEMVGIGRMSLHAYRSKSTARCFPARSSNMFCAFQNRSPYIDRVQRAYPLTFLPTRLPYMAGIVPTTSRRGNCFDCPWFQFSIVVSRVLNLVLVFCL